MVYKPDYKYLPPLEKDWLTPVYDLACSLVNLGKNFKRQILNSAQLRDNMTIVDIGCGTGVFLKIAGQKYPTARLVGLDPDKQALAIAKRRLARVHLAVDLEEAFAESLPFADQSVDICFSALVFHHLPNNIKREAIKEIYRVLKNGGQAVIGDFGARKNIWLRRVLFFEKLEYLEGNFRGLIPRYLEESGFKNVKIAGRRWPGIDIVVAEK